MLHCDTVKNYVILGDSIGWHTNVSIIFTYYRVTLVKLGVNIEQ